MTVSGAQLTCELIRRSGSRGRQLNLVSVQKLAYFCHGWHWALRGEPLIDEAFEPWRFGPLLSHVHYRFEAISYGALPPAHPYITRHADGCVLDEESSRIIDGVLDRYAECTDEMLIDLACTPDGPWAEACNAKRYTIDDNKICQYFQRLDASDNVEGVRPWAI